MKPEGAVGLLLIAVVVVLAAGGEEITLDIPAGEEAFGQLLALLQEPSYSRTFAKDDQFTLGYVVYLSFATEETWAWTYHFQGGKLIQAGPTDQTKTYQISGGQATQERILDFLLAQR